MTWKWAAEMPSTNVRIANSILMAMGTFLLMAVTALIVVIRGDGKSWEPSEIWLGFLVLWAGLDVTQFLGKRSTSTEYVAAKQGAPPPEDPKPPEVGT